MKAIIIDDEKQAISALKMELSLHCPDIEIIGTARTIADGKKLLESTLPDVLFLDIQLKNGTGFDLLSQLSNTANYQIVFTTAHNHYAIKAFKFNAVDYLLKPIDPEELISAVARIKKRGSNEEALNQAYRNISELLPKINSNSKIALQSAGKICLVPINSIIRVQANGNYAQFFFSDKRKPLLISKTLKDYDLSLSKYGFIRTHLSHLVNLDHIESYHAGDGGYITTTDGCVVPVSQRKRPEVLRAIKNGHL